MAAMIAVAVKKGHSGVIPEHWPSLEYSRPMGHRVAFIVLGTATIVGALGCGGASKPTRTKPITSFSSHCDNCGHHYTVKQVETAFAAQGIPLHRPKNQPIHGFVLLQGGQKPRVVATLVKVSATKTKLPKLSHSLPLHPPKAIVSDFVFVVARSRHYRLRRDGDVTALFDPSKAQSVRAALAQLH